MSRRQHLIVVLLFIVTLGYFAGQLSYQDTVVVLLTAIAVVAVREVENG
jgi:hypothetical protein